jgi:HEAT repeat protein
LISTSTSRNDDEGVSFLIKVAESDPDRELRKQALFWLGQKAGKRSLEVLGNVVERSDADTEVQKHAVFAISQRPRDEAIPLLIKIAKTHPKAEVRKQAIFWLGQTGDERALEFFKEILAK